MDAEDAVISFCKFGSAHFRTSLQKAEAGETRIRTDGSEILFDRRILLSRLRNTTSQQCLKISCFICSLCICILPFVVCSFVCCLLSAVCLLPLPVIRLPVSCASVSLCLLSEIDSPSFAFPV